MDFSQNVSVVTCKLSDNTKVTFESDENDFDAGVVWKATKTWMQEAQSYLVESTLVKSDKNVMVVGNELPSCSKNVILPPGFNTDAVLEKRGTTRRKYPVTATPGKDL